MFAAVRGARRHVTADVSAETPHAAVRTVKLSTSYFFGGVFLAPSAVRSVDFRDHKEVRRGQRIFRSASKANTRGGTLPGA
jgi:hypothetical protein